MFCSCVRVCVCVCDPKGFSRSVCLVWDIASVVCASACVYHHNGPRINILGVVITERLYPMLGLASSLRDVLPGSMLPR